MSDLKDRVSKEIIAAMKAKDKIRLNALRYLKKLFIENDTSSSPKPEMDIVIAHAKKTKESIEMYPEGSSQRDDILAEYKVLEEYLPSQLSESDVAKMINDILSGLENPNMGAVMKELSPKIKGQFDGKLASQMVNQALKK
jgi:uncharacterized protein YqeY